MVSRGRFLGRGSWLQFRNQSTSILPPNIMHFSRDRATIRPRLSHDRATIAPRSGHDRGPGRSSIDARSVGGDSPCLKNKLIKFKFAFSESGAAT